MARRTRQRPSLRRPQVRGRVWLASVVSLALRLCAQNVLLSHPGPRLSDGFARIALRSSAATALVSHALRPRSLGPPSLRFLSDPPMVSGTPLPRQACVRTARRPPTAASARRRPQRPLARCRTSASQTVRGAAGVGCNSIAYRVFSACCCDVCKEAHLANALTSSQGSFGVMTDNAMASGRAAANFAAAWFLQAYEGRLSLLTSCSAPCPLTSWCAALPLLCTGFVC